MKKYKSTIQCTGCIAKVTPVLDEVVGKGQWSVDLTSPARTLTIEPDVPAEIVAKALAQVGYKAEPIS
ncbi:MAG TPA: heavy metal-associated domain-containing protein [Chryseolinea sp.]|nr:heavy metal-associated domain-containing protein [Chryseolinea sp.]